MTALASAARGEKLPTIDVTLAYVKACGADPAIWSARWQAASDALSTDFDEGQEQKPPYLGLTAFESTDANLFFGREQLIEKLCERLASSSFIAVFGPSGSGKSSLLRAGLIPAMEEHDADVATVLFTPGEHPTTELAVRLGDRQNTAAGTDAAAAIDRALGEDPEVRLVIVVDQFEEIFTHCKDRAQRAEFIDVLLNAAETEERVKVVLGVRADFYGRCADHPPLVEALRDHQVLIGAMTEEQLRSVIIKPAEYRGLKVEAALVEAIIAEVAGQPDVLPLLSHALLETWRRRRGQVLTLAAYRQVGGVRGAIAKTADHVYEEFTPEQQQLAKELFLRLTALGEGTEDTRRRVGYDELLAKSKHKTVPVVLERLAQARLVALDENSMTVTHEALIRGWPTLRSWLVEERQLLRRHRSLTEAAGEWDGHDREASFLYRGLRLDTYQDFPEAHLNDLERAFLTASRQVKKAEQVQRRRKRPVTMLKWGAAALVLSVLVLLTIVQIGNERDISQSRELAATVSGQLDRDPQLALLLADEAVQLSPTEEANTALRQAIVDNRVRAVVPTGQGPTVGVAFSRSGKLLATSGVDGSIRLWQRTEGSAAPGSPRTLTALTGPASSPAFSPDDRYLAAAGSDGTVAVWDLVHGGDPKLLRGHTGQVRSVAFNPDSDRLASAGDDGTVRLWDLANPGNPQVRNQPGSARSVTFAPDGQQLASGGSDGMVRIWQLTGAAAPRTLPGNGTVAAVVFSPDGQVLVSGGSDSLIRIWRLTGDAPPQTLTGNGGTVEAIAFSPDGQTIASGGSDSMVRVSSAPGNINSLVLSGHAGPIWSVAFSPEGTQVASVGQDGILRLWDPAGLGAPQVLKTGHTAVTSAAYGQQVAAGNEDGSLHLWDPATGRTRTFTAHRGAGAVRSVGFSPDGNQLASAGDDGIVRLWDPATGQATPLTGHTGAVRSVAFNPIGNQLASAGDDGIVRLWDPATGQARTLTGHAGAVRSVAFSPDGNQLASAGDDGIVRLWDLATNQAKTLTGHIGAIRTVAFKTDGTHLASAGDDGTVRFWDLSTGQARTLTGHIGTVWSVAFSADGDWLASSGQDGTIRLWRPGALGESVILRSIGGAVNQIAFAPGPRLVTADGNGAVRIWQCAVCAPSVGLRKLARERLFRELTPSERETFLATN